MFSTFVPSVIMIKFLVYIQKIHKMTIKITNVHPLCAPPSALPKCIFSSKIIFPIKIRAENEKFYLKLLQKITRKIMKYRWTIMSLFRIQIEIFNLIWSLFVNNFCITLHRGRVKIQNYQLILFVGRFIYMFVDSLNYDRDHYDFFWSRPSF